MMNESGICLICWKGNGLNMKMKLTGIVFFLLFIDCVCADGYDVVILKSRDARPYNRVTEGFQSVGNGNVSALTLSDKTGNDLEIKKRLKSLSPDIVFAIGTNALIFANDETDNIPIVYCLVLKPEQYVTKERDMTGIAFMASVKFQAQKLKLINPDIKRIGVMYDPGNSSSLIKESKLIFKESGIDLIAKKVYSTKAVPAVLRSLEGKVDMLWLIPDGTVMTEESFAYMVSYSLQKNFPILTHAESFVRAGCLISFSVDYLGVGKQAAEIVEKMVENDTKFPLLVDAVKLKMTINKILAREFNIKLNNSNFVESDEKVYIYDFMLNENMSFKKVWLSRESTMRIQF